MKNIPVLVFSLCLFTFAHAAPDGDRYLLTIGMLKKMQAVNAELSKANTELDDEDDNENNDNLSLEEFARQIDSQPKVKATLARHGLTSMEYALAMQAIIAAAVHLGFEPSMDKKKAASLYASYPKERQANIELLRKNPQYLK